MKFIKKLIKWIGYVLLIPIIYVLISLLLTYISVNKKDHSSPNNKVIYLSTNGVHLDIVIPKKSISSELVFSLKQHHANYFAFGWGDENFYLNTPTWGDLTFKNAFSALFLKSPTLIHVTRYDREQKDWIEIKLSSKELDVINNYIAKSFVINADKNKIIVPNGGYGYSDDFYKANGSYSCFKTCNSWVNSAFKQSGLKACLWTPFDFGLMQKYD